MAGDIRYDGEQTRPKTYDDGFSDGKREGRALGYDNGLSSGRSECKLERQAEEREKQRQAEQESRRKFWDTAYSDEPKMDPKAVAREADTDVKSFMKDVQRMNMKEFITTESELNNIYDQKKADWRQTHKWWDVLHGEPRSPMTVARDNSGLVSSIEFPGYAYKIPVTYWNSAVEAAKLDTLSQAAKNAGDPITREIAEKSLVSELNTLKIPQIAELEVRRQKDSR